jgi:RNA 2',3'-cyclic 3'-phosphodiesterase
VALDLPAAVREALPAPPPPFRALRSEALHVTLAFLGWRPEEDVARVVEVLDPPGVGELSLAEVVLLPPRRPRVMAVRLDDPSGECRRCQAAISAALAEAGLYEPERREWLPHVTIGRALEPVRRGGEVPSLPALSFTPPSVSLYRSRLSPGGAQYEPLRVWPV